MKKNLFVLTIAFVLIGLTVVRVTAAPIEPFDVYGDVNWELEQIHLDNFAIFLNENPTYIGYIFVWAGNPACKGEAFARAQRAKKYLVEFRNVDSKRVIWHDNGYASDAKTILQPGPPGGPMLEFDSFVKPNEVKFLKRCINGIPVRKNTIKSKSAHNRRLKRTRLSVT